MAISEAKKKIVIDNYFKKECDVNTSIKEAFIKGFELGLKKASMPQPKMGHWIECMPRGTEEWSYKCSECNFWKYKKTINLSKFKFCPNCGTKMEIKECENCKHYGEDLHGAFCRFCQDIKLWEVKENG